MYIVDSGAGTDLGKILIPPIYIHPVLTEGVNNGRRIPDGLLYKKVQFVI